MLIFEEIPNIFVQTEKKQNIVEKPLTTSGSLGQTSTTTFLLLPLLVKIGALVT